MTQSKKSRAKAQKPAVETLAPSPGGKLGKVIELLRRPEGASIAQLQEATGWQPHSVRGAIAGAIKKKHDLTAVSEKTEAGRVYRIAAAVEA